MTSYMTYYKYSVILAVNAVSAADEPRSFRCPGDVDDDTFE